MPRHKSEAKEGAGSDEEQKPEDTQPETPVEPAESKATSEPELVESKGKFSIYRIGDAFVMRRGDTLIGTYDGGTEAKNRDAAHNALFGMNR